MLIDATRVLHRKLFYQRFPTGIDRIVEAYLNYFNKETRILIRIGSFQIILNKNTSETFIKLMSAQNRNGFSDLSRLLLSELKNFKDHSYDFKKKWLLNIGHSGLEKESYIRWINRNNLKLFTLVHDLIPITHPNLCRSGEKNKHEIRIFNIITQSQKIITNSEATKDSLIWYAKKIQRLLPDTQAMSLPTTKLPIPNSTRPIAEPYFLILGTIEARKNHLFILKLWQKIRLQLGSYTPKLVMIGQRGWECHDVFDILKKTYHLNGDIIELNTCDDLNLSRWIYHAQALLMPSIIEGYGMPLIEAMELGTPIIANNLKVFNEIGKSIPCFIDIKNERVWLEKIIDYIDSNNKDRRRQIEASNNFSSLSHEKYFQKIKSILNN